MVQNLVTTCCIFIATVCAMVLAIPAPQRDPATIKLLNSYNDNKGDGSYKFGYEQSNHQFVSEQGVLKEVVGTNGQPRKVVVSSGEYHYRNSLGQIHYVTWTADENGYHPIIRTYSVVEIGLRGDKDDCDPLAIGKGNCIDPKVLKSLLG